MSVSLSTPLASPASPTSFMATDVMPSAHEDKRVRLRFSVDGLSAREEIMLKSLIRLLAERSNQCWVYSTDNPDVRVVGEDFLPQLTASDLSASRPVLLLVGHSQQKHEYFLHLPMHANELELLLNRIGQRLARPESAPDVEKTREEPRAAVPVAASVALFSRAPFEDNEGFILNRWPPAAMLGSPLRIRLATMMHGKAWTLEQLQKRAAASRQECADFVESLRRAELLARAEPASQPAAAVAPQHERQPPPRTPVAAAASGRMAYFGSQRSEAGAEVSRPSLGLLARIRSRLGLSAPHST